MKGRVFCNRECFKNHTGKKVTKPCEACGKDVTRVQSQMFDRVFCNRDCAKEYTSPRMTNMNAELNKTRMTLEVRTKLRAVRLGTGEGKTYEKTFGRHTHRIVAEEKLGRELRKGEVVHHIDENKRNNSPDNLMVLSSQAEHFRIHFKPAQYDKK